MNQQPEAHPKSWSYGELWDLLDQNRKPLGKTHPRGLKIPEGSYHVISEIWTVDPLNRILLTLRSADKEFYPNLWEVTAGSVLAGESSRDGAVRELLEETGLKEAPDALHLISTFDFPGVFVDIYAHRMKVASVNLQQGETSSYRFATLDQIDELIAQGKMAPHIIHHLHTCREGLEFFLHPTVEPGRYRHYKGGEYEALGMATHSETGEPMVVYRALYGDQKVWVRPAAMWNDLILRGNLALRRFSRMEK